MFFIFAYCIEGRVLQEWGVAKGGTLMSDRIIVPSDVNGWEGLKDFSSYENITFGPNVSANLKSQKPVLIKKVCI